jgi:3-hydroxyisobutyrate dehydrogenase-like beta-hydroxyacid dehydrogenase
VTNDLRVGFVGLGSQGGPMARRIAEAGFPTTLWARRPESLAPFAGTATTTAASPRELGAASDVVCVCVVADADVDEVLRGDDGVLGGMDPGGVVVVHSTVHPETCRRLQADFGHLHVLDAPVSGGGHRAAEGTLLVMVGGAPDVFERCRPIFQTYASPLVHLGPLGAGQHAKLLNNALFAAQLELAADVFALAAERGLDVASLATALGNGSGRSYALEIVAGSGHDLETMASLAGALLAKDVAILTDLLPAGPTSLLTAAQAAVARMGLR